MDLRSYQIEAISKSFEWIKSGKKRFVLQSPTGCHREGQRVLAFDGSPIPVEAVRAGDTLLGLHGSRRKVIELHRGYEQMLRISPELGKSFVVNHGHILSLIDDSDRIEDMTVAQWEARHDRHRWRLFRVPEALARAPMDTRDLYTRVRFTVHPLGEENYYGFTLDGDGRYLLDDFTVTHNSGKTVIAAQLVRQAVKQNVVALFVAHRLELLEQAKNKLIDFGLEEDDINMILPGRKPRPSARIHVASVQSLATRPTLRDVRLVIVDEAHRSAAKTYYKHVFEPYSNATIIGMTATPARLDNKPLDMYDDILVVAQPRTLIDQGFIVEPRTFTVPDSELPDLTDVHVRGGDYDEHELEAAVNKKHLVGSIVQHYKERAEGMRAIAFATSIKHSKEIVDMFMAEGITAEHIDGECRESHRNAVIERLRSGETMVVSQVGLWIEGVDVPEAKCAILARPTKSLTTHLQSIGRVVRPWNDITPVVLDHAGNSIDLGLMSQDRTYSLYSKIKALKSDDTIRGWRCEACLMVNDPGKMVCDACGAERPKKPRKLLRTVEGKLIEIKPSDEDKKGYWNSLWRRAYANGELPSWVPERYFKRFGENPPDDWAPPQRAKPAFTYSQILNDVYRLQSVCVKQGLPKSWVIQKTKMKYDVDIDPSWDPVTFINTMNEKYMNKRSAEICEAWKRYGFEAPPRETYGLGMMTPPANKDNLIRFYGQDGKAAYDRMHPEK